MCVCGYTLAAQSLARARAVQKDRAERSRRRHGQLEAAHVLHRQGIAGRAAQPRLGWEPETQRSAMLQWLALCVRVQHNTLSEDLKGNGLSAHAVTSRENARPALGRTEQCLHGAAHKASKFGVRGWDGGWFQ